VSANAFSITESYDLLPDGRISQMFSNGLWQNNNVYANGNVLATYSGSSMYFQMNDWLGTKRAQISSDGNTANFNTWYSLPYGNSQIQSGGQDVNGLHFTGKERDLETAPGTGNGNDYFGARYYGSSMGRFLSPDWADKPEAVPYSDLSNPQSLNLYGYVKNNPLRSADPDGHEDCCDDLLQFAGGVVQGAASSVSFGLIGVPRSSDSNASLAGQLVGTSIIGGTGTSVVSESGPTAVAGLALAPETGGASLVVSAGAVGASGVGSEMVAGAAKNGAAVAAVMAMKGDNGADKGASPGTGKDRTLEGKTSQVKDIQEAQKNARAGKTKKLIDSTNKSEQNLDNHLKDIHHLSDVE
jgi:RHS repeat-associated protein